MSLLSALHLLGRIALTLACAALIGGALLIDNRDADRAIIGWTR